MIKSVAAMRFIMSIYGKEVRFCSMEYVVSFMYSCAWLVDGQECYSFYVLWWWWCFVITCALLIPMLYLLYTVSPLYSLNIFYSNFVALHIFFCIEQEDSIYPLLGFSIMNGGVVRIQNLQSNVGNQINGLLLGWHTFSWWQEWSI